MAQNHYPDQNYTNDFRTTGISRTSRSNTRPLIQEDFILQHRMSQRSEGRADLQEHSWPEDNSLASPTPLGTTGWSEFADPQQSTPDCAPERIEVDDDCSETCDLSSNARYQFQGDHQYCPNSANPSHAQDETTFNVEHEADNVIHTLTSSINM